MTRDELCARIPHGGDMCLLARAERWDDHTIVCYADSHRDAANPLRGRGQLHAVCGVEYAAQAMALHASLAPLTDNAAPAMGYLASVRDLKLNVTRLDDIAEELRVEATRVVGSTEGFMYSFEIHAGARLLLAGRAMVKLMNAGPSP